MFKSQASLLDVVHCWLWHT